MAELIDKEQIFSKVTNLYKNAKGEKRTAYRNVLDIICDLDIVDDNAHRVEVENLKSEMAYLNKRFREENVCLAEQRDIWISRYNELAAVIASGVQMQPIEISVKLDDLPAEMHEKLKIILSQNR
jgi:hypothetical protein